MQHIFQLLLMKNKNCKMFAFMHSHNCSLKQSLFVVKIHRKQPFSNAMEVFLSVTVKKLQKESFTNAGRNEVWSLIYQEKRNEFLTTYFVSGNELSQVLYVTYLFYPSKTTQWDNVLIFHVQMTKLRFREV